MKSASWFKDAIVYQVLIDRFAGYTSKEWDKPHFMGGNLKGIIDKLDYINDLGFNTVWLSPFCKTSAYHGYHVTDYFEVEPQFGTKEDLKKLIDKAHNMNIRIIADFVPNHCSRKHPFFLEASKDKKSKYFPWFSFKRWPDKYLCFLDFKEIPKLNLSHPEAKKHVIDSARYWLSLGIDGFRLDHVVGPRVSFWKEFSKAVKAANPEAVLIGEAWFEGITFKHLETIHIRNKYLRWIFGINEVNLQKEYIGILDGVLDFNFRKQTVKYISWEEKPKKHAQQLKMATDQFYKKFPENYYLPTFLDNHDMSRFLFECGNDKEKLKLALAFQFGLPQPPIVYCGTEAGLTHEKPVVVNQAYADLQVRQPMPWDNPDKKLLAFCKELIKQRKNE